jgi:hypothetical protein
MIKTMVDIYKSTLEPEEFEIYPPTARDKNYRNNSVQNSVVREQTIIHMNQLDIPFKTQAHQCGCFPLFCRILGLKLDF